MSDIAQPQESNRLLKGGFWAVIGRWSVKFLGLLSTLFVVRLLMPQDFGIIMKLMLAMGPVGICVGIGFSETLIRIKAPTKQHYDTAFTANVMLSILGAIFLCLTAPLMAWIFKEPILTHLMPIMACKMLLIGFINPRRIDFQREFQYITDFKYTVLNKIIHIICVVGACFYFRNYYGLVVGQIGGIFGEIIISYLMIHYKPAFSFKYIKEFCDFSFPNMRAGVGEYILMNLDRLLLVRYLSNTMLGFYNLAYELAEQFTTEVIYPLARGFFPVFSALENNKEKLKQTYLSSVSFLIPLCLAVGIGLSAIAEPLILIYAGDKWLQTIDLLNILALSAAAQAFCLVNATVLGATGRMKHRARLTTTNAIISTIIMLPFAINGDIMSVLMAKLGVTLGFVFINLWVVCQQLDITPKEIMSHFTRPIIAAIVMIITLNWINIHNPYWAFIVILMCGFISFIATQFTLWFLSGKPKTIEHTILQKVRFL